MANDLQHQWKCKLGLTGFFPFPVRMDIKRTKEIKPTPESLE